MSWFLDYIDKSNNIEFYQIFNKFNQIDIDDTNIYNLNNNDIVYNYLLLDKYKILENNYQIKIKDNLILYTNLDDNKSLLFNIKMNFINENDNYYKLPLFYNKYKLMDVHYMPFLSNNMYDQYYSKINFKVYKIANNVLYIIENNTDNNLIRGYIITININNNFNSKVNYLITYKNILDKFTNNHV